MQKKQKHCVWSIISIISALIPIFLTALFFLPIDILKAIIIFYTGFGSLILPLPLLALIFGVIALIKIKHNSNLKGKWLAIFGMSIGIIIILMFLTGVLKLEFGI